MQNWTSGNTAEYVDRLFVECESRGVISGVWYKWTLRTEIYATDYDSALQKCPNIMKSLEFVYGY